MRTNIIALSVIIFTYCMSAQQMRIEKHSKMNIDCKTCHTCDVPTKADPCLTECPREKIATVYQKPEQTPELIKINQLSDRYEPVYFSHKLHAQMAAISDGCENCHHHNTSGPILKCNKCHEVSRQREDVGIPDLKGAYHRQCMDCHREWSHETGCNSCHNLKTDGEKSSPKFDYKKYAGKDHPDVVVPSVINYKTKSDRGEIVTFSHNDHTKSFGLKCTNCHKHESCSKCHDVSHKTSEKPKEVKTELSFEQQHKNCINCHEKNEQCNRCHGRENIEPFNHTKKTGWALNRHHEKLACSKCHGQKIPYKKIDNKCSSCHQAWNKENFKHSITGLQLDETHIELSCEDCHLEGNFELKPSCNGCHENFSYPNKKPGQLIRN
ncbi:MAG: hypothetical protein HY964_01830 [Ignavibacteriales bacterium]|nr:hypothetical protein [Ignavibacteriales bacterium]